MAGPIPFGNAGRGPQPFNSFGGGIPFVPNPPLQTRYFRRNEGTTDYATIPEVTLAGDFVIELNGLATSVGHLLSSRSSNNFRFAVFNSTMIVGINGSEVIFDASSVDFSVLNSIMLTRVGSDIGCRVNNVQLTQTSGTGSSDAIAIDSIYQRWGQSTGVPVWSGIIANLRISDDGTLARDYPIGDNSDTLVDRVSGQNGTVINGNADDWGLFNEQATGEWLGGNVFDFTTVSSIDPDWTISLDSGSVDTTNLITAPASFTDTSKMIIGSTYRCSFSVDSFVGSGSCGFGLASFGGVSLGDRVLSADGQFNRDMVATSANINMFRFVDSGSGSNNLSSVSVEEVLNVA